MYIVQVYSKDFFFWWGHCPPPACKLWGRVLPLPSFSYAYVRTRAREHTHTHCESDINQYAVHDKATLLNSTSINAKNLIYYVHRVYSGTIYVWLSDFLTNSICIPSAWFLGKYSNPVVFVRLLWLGFSDKILKWKLTWWGCSLTTETRFVSGQTTKQDSSTRGSQAISRHSHTYTHVHTCTRACDSTTALKVGSSFCMMLVVFVGNISSSPKF